MKTALVISFVISVSKSVDFGSSNKKTIETKAYSNNLTPASPLHFVKRQESYCQKKCCERAKAKKLIKNKKCRKRREVTKLKTADKNAYLHLVDYNSKPNNKSSIPRNITTESVNYKVIVEEIKRLAFFSYVIHMPFEKLIKWECKLCDSYKKPREMIILMDKSQCYTSLVGLDHHKREIFAFFKGSDTNNFKIHNLNHSAVTMYDKLNQPLGQVGGGFYKYFQNFEDSVLDFIKFFADEYPEYTIVLGGQSLGAACSILASIKLKSNYEFSNKLKVYPLALPVFCDKKLSEWIDENLDLLFISNANDFFLYEMGRRNFYYPKNKILIFKETNLEDGYTLIHCIEDIKACEIKNYDTHITAFRPLSLEAETHTAMLGITYTDYGNMPDFIEYFNLLASSETREFFFEDYLNTVAAISSSAYKIIDKAVH